MSEIWHTVKDGFLSEGETDMIIDLYFLIVTVTALFVISGCVWHIIGE